ncbi:glutathione transferase GstA [Bdellovibrio sp. HCB185ZH]|uniref:glutathione transferase GstA n=1 Tax=Bdellovibrio sp. HCB185ZH TaxID=3394235 RepID=UPI0039A5A0D8
MNLFYSPGACALSSQIALREAGLNFELVKVDLKAKEYSGGDYKKINPKGYIPALQLPNGHLMTEGAVILQWIADQVPEKNLLPKFGTMERYKAMEWLNFIATEIHKGLGSLFGGAVMNEETKEQIKGKVQLRLAVLDQHLQQNAFILGNEFSVADAYAYNVLRWTGLVGVDIAQHKALQNFIGKMSERPTVKEAVAAEGIRL